MAGYLFVSHDLGGGTEAQLQDLRRQLEAEGAQILFARPGQLHSGRFRICTADGRPLPGLADLSLEDDPSAALLPRLAVLGITHVHIHHLYQFGLAAPRFFAALARSGALRVDMTLHDYYPVCPQITLMDAPGIYCGMQSPPICQNCVDRIGSFIPGPVNVADWRRDNLALLQAVRALFAPSHDMAQRLGRLLGDRPVLVREHATDPALATALRAAPTAPQNRTDGPARHIGLLGAMGMSKGAKLLFDTAHEAIRLGLPLRFTVIGYTVRDDLFAGLPNVTITGPYPSQEVLDRITRTAPDLIWLPSVWPETFCFTLTETMAAGVMPVVFDLGAQAQRLRETGWGQVMPRALMRDPAGAAHYLATCPVTPPPTGARASLIRDFPGAAAYYATA